MQEFGIPPVPRVKIGPLLVVELITLVPRHAVIIGQLVKTVIPKIPAREGFSRVIQHDSLEHGPDKFA